MSVIIKNTANRRRAREYFADVGRRGPKAAKAYEKAKGMIQEGLLWFDNSPTRPVTEKIGRAIARYCQKYHHDPDVCYIHPNAVTEGMTEVDGVKVLSAKSVLPHHFWLGVMNSGDKKQVHQGR